MHFITEWAINTALAFLVGVVLILNVGANSAVSAQVILATTSLSEGLFKIGAGATRIRLGQSDDILKRLSLFPSPSRVFLVLTQVRAKPQAQVAVLFEVFLAPESQEPAFVGTFNLFELNRPLETFDVSQLLAGLVDRGFSGRQLVVTIRPNLPETAAASQRQAIEDADITVAQVSLVAQ
jgi:hypothetical protein